MNQLLNQIERSFSKMTATQLSEYFVHHQFEWKDIVDDINVSYDSCCCKKILFEQQCITDNKKQLYSRLKACLKSNHSPIPSVSMFDELFEDALKAFSIIFNTQNAKDIVHSFKTIVHKEFEDIESIKEDVEDVNSSQIIPYVIGNINYNNFDKNTEQNHDIIENGIKLICIKQTERFIKEYTNTLTPHHDITPFKPMSITPHHDTIPFKPMQTDSLTIFVESIGQQIKKDLSTEIAQLFETSVCEQEFDDVDAVKEDMEDIDNSSILEYIADQSNQNKDIYSIQTKIKDIVMNHSFSLIITQHNHNERKEVEDKDIINIKTQIQTQFTSKYNEAVARKILNKLNQIVTDKDFDSENLADDVKDINNSELFEELDDIKEISQDDIRRIQQIISCHEKIDIKDFEFNVTVEEIGISSKFVTHHCIGVYQHLMGIAKTLDLSDLTSNQNKKPKIEGKSLCIAKAIDRKNNKPIMYWLLMLFSKQRSAKYRNKQLLKSRKYTVNDWWFENKYCQWIQNKNHVIGDNIEAGLADLVKRTLPPLNYNYPLFPIIYDTLDDFVDYALAFHEVAHRIHNLHNGIDGNLESLPIQIDYWIIPRMTKEKEANKQSMPFDPDDLSGAVSATHFVQESKLLKLSEDSEVGGDIWNIEDILTHRKLGYIKNKDYFVAHVPDDSGSTEDRKGLLGLMRKHHTFDDRHNRYIFIIDRRDPDINKDNWDSLTYEAFINQEKTWSDTIYMIGGKQYRNENGEPLCTCGVKLEKSKTQNIHKDATCAWCARSLVNAEKKKILYCPKSIDEHKECEHKEAYYLCSDKCEEVRPDTFSKISTAWKGLPEACLSLSKSYILLNPHSYGSSPITLDDALNGYMFGMSYHILQEETISAYWYHNASGTVFQLSDIEKGWPQWFNKINDKPQTVNLDIFKKKELPNKDFQNFEKQCNAI